MLVCLLNDYFNDIQETVHTIALKSNLSICAHGIQFLSIQLYSRKEAVFPA